MTEPNQLQKTLCGLTLHKIEDIDTDDAIINDDGSKIITKPVECACFDLEECRAMMPTTTPASTTTTEPVPTTTGEADKRLEELKDDANRFRGQFAKNSFSILSQRSLDTGTIMQLCNGIRVDFEYILTRNECCNENVQLIKGKKSKLFFKLSNICIQHAESTSVNCFLNFNLEFLKGNDTHPVTFPISSSNIKKDPCSNVDPVVKETCQESPVDCPDVALRHCNENNLEAGSNCFIQARNSQIMTSFSLFLGTR